MASATEISRSGRSGIAGKFRLREFRVTVKLATANPVHISRFRKSAPLGSVISNGSTMIGNVSRSCSLHWRRMMLFWQSIMNNSTAKKPVQISTGRAQART